MRWRCVRLLFRLTMSVPEQAFETRDGMPLLVTGNLWFRLVLSLVGHLAVDPTNPVAMKEVIRILQSGRPVMIFPEGRITNTGSLTKVYDGPALVAAKTGARIVPVRPDGPARWYFSRLSGRLATTMRETDQA
jgi:1-acyl-sn-glycerol-3-phosphate acyltransferase